MSDLIVHGRLTAPRRASIGIAGTLLEPQTMFRSVHGPLSIDDLSLDWMRSSSPKGLTDVVDEVVSWLECQKLEKTVLIGHSSGGAIAFLVALRRPDLIDGLLIVNTGANTIGHGDPDAPKRLAAGLTPDVVEPFIARCFDEPPAPKDLASLRRYAQACRPKDAIAAMQSQRAMDLVPLLPSIICPVTVIYGVKDRVRSLEHAQELVHLVADGQLVTLDCGHSAVYERPEAVSEELAALWARVDQT